MEHRRALTGVLVVISAVAVIAFAGYTVFTFDSQTKIDPSSAPPLPPITTPSSTIPAAVTKISLPAHPKVVAIGDSWIEGVGAEPQSEGFFTLTTNALGWDARLLPGGSGTGYMDNSMTAKYSTRLREAAKDPAVDLVFIHGGLNDYDNLSDGDESGAVERTVSAARAQFKNAEVLIVGPMSDNPNPSSELRTLEDQIEYGARLSRVAYISPLDGEWLRDQPNFEDLWSTTAPHHPNTEGHRLYAERLEAAVRELMSGQ